MSNNDFSVYYPLLREPVHGPEAFKQVLMGVHAGLPDVETVSEDMIAEGNQAVVRWTMRGTHTGELLGIPPTGKQVTLTGITIYRLTDGKIVEERGELDNKSGNGNGNGIYNNHLLLLDIDRPLPLGTHLTCVTPNKEVKSATVVEAGYYTLVVYNDDTTISIIGYTDIISLA